MSQNKFSNPESSLDSEAVPYGWIALAVLSLLAMLLVVVAFVSPLGPSLHDLATWLFALDTPQNITWYITRSSGMMAYLLLWLSTAWGLAIPSKVIDRLLHRSFTFDFHQVISLLSLGFLGLHIFILMADQFLPFSLAQILVPFISPYRPFWVGIGVLATYISILVTATFYLRQRIGLKTFRIIHLTSFIGYLGATIHGIASGTDSALPVAMLMYIGTFLVIVFLTAYWLLMLWQDRHLQSVSFSK
jgi:sulfoxide reductase heme-binding subunit YedZ